VVQRVVLRADEHVQREHGFEERRVRERDALGRVGRQVEPDAAIPMSFRANELIMADRPRTLKP
jgi:hypothetical protein